MKGKFFAALGRIFKKPHVKAGLCAFAVIAACAGLISLLVFKPDMIKWFFVCIMVFFIFLCLYFSFLDHFEK